MSKNEQPGSVIENELSVICTRQIFIPSINGGTIWGDVRWKDSQPERSSPILIICHGFKAFKDWGPFPEIGNFFAEKGFVSIIFNFSHNGVEVGKNTFSDPDRFAVNSVGKDLDDIQRILNYISEGKLENPAADSSRIGIAGHSRGGGVAILTGRKDDRIWAVAGWGTIAFFDRYSSDQKIRWREKGKVDLPAIPSRYPFIMKTDFLDDIEIHLDEYDIVNAAAELQKPLLLIHGKNDITVRLNEPEKIFAASEKKLTQFIILEQADHSFGALSGSRKIPDQFHRVLELTSSWFHAQHSFRNCI